MNGQSDQELLMTILHGEAAALSSLYDRYGCLVFTLATTTEPACAELITEEVFLELWRLARVDQLTEPVLATLLLLTAEAAARYQQENTPAACARWGQPVLPALAPFAQLQSDVFDLLVLTCLGGLTVDEIATALGRDRSTILKGLAAGFASVRGRSVSLPEERMQPFGEESRTLQSSR